MLYIRMIIVMGVSLYTSRIILNTLGVEDFGIYNVVGGFVVMIGFLNSAMSSAVQRFISIEIGRKDYTQLGNVFNMSVNIHLLAAVLILVVAETIGLWFVQNQLTIPPERFSAAMWVYQFSILALIAHMLNVPYHSTIIAHERMNVFAWISVVEVSLKLFIVFMLQWFGFDKLKLYALLMFSLALIIRLVYRTYCNRNFPESKFKIYWNTLLFKKMTSFASWNLIGTGAHVLYGQGINVLLNIFFGPVVNAARGIAYQVRGAVMTFMINFQIAINPQIIKSFASKDLKYMHQLIFRGAKFSFFLIFLFSVPILLETGILLNLWLKIVPDYTIIFTQLAIINVLIDSVGRPLMTAAQASGKIKLYQSITGGLLLLILPLSWIFLKLGFPPQVTLYVSISMSIIVHFPLLKIVSNLVGLSIREYIQNVFYKIIPVAMISIIPSLLIKYFMDPGIYRLIIMVFTSSVSIAISVYLIGLSSVEKTFIDKQVMQLIGKAKVKFVN